MPSRFNEGRLNLIAIKASRIPVIGVHKAGECNAPLETAAVESPTTPAVASQNISFLMSS
jgi:hypothetical protein